MGYLENQQDSLGGILQRYTLNRVFTTFFCHFLQNTKRIVGLICWKIIF